MWHNSDLARIGLIPWPHEKLERPLEKLYVLHWSTSDYDYDYHQSGVDAVLLGPAGLTKEVLSAEYYQMVGSNRKAERAAWDALPKPRKPMRYTKPMSFVDWLVENKSFKRVEHEVWD